MNSKKGFTLIELLAVIVILAIIALIAVPIVLNIINDSKESSGERSAELYIDAVEQAVASNLLINANAKTDGIYTIANKGKTLTKKDVTLTPSYKGKGLTEGKIVIKNGKVTSILRGKVDNSHITYIDNKIKLIKNYKESTLLAGDSFNVAIKNFAENTTNYTTSNMEYTHDSSVVQYISFYSNGTLPEGYTKEKLKDLDSIDVSESQDGSIKAYIERYTENGNDKAKIYVYSENQIMANEDSSYMLGLFHGLKEIDLKQLDTSKVTNMSHMFHYDTALTKTDVSNFDTSNVTDMSHMFEHCHPLTSLDISSFDTSNVTDMSYMFSHFLLTSLDISNFDTSNVTDMSNMFGDCYSLTSLDVRNFDTSKVTNMSWMFEYCNSLTSLDVSNFDTSNVTDMNGMFYRCESLTSLDLSSFDTIKVTDMRNMFYYSNKLKTIKVSDKWVIGGNTKTSSMFENCGTDHVTVY